MDLLRPPFWMSKVLTAAGVYNLLWGLMVVLLPQRSLSWAGLNTPVDYPQIWQCVGMIVGVYGIGYLIAARNPYDHWAIVLVGFLGKVFGPIGYVWNVISGTLPASMFWTILFNDLIWWIPFAAILWGAFRSRQAMASVHAAAFLDDDPVHELVSSDGRTLFELSSQQPQLVVFLRHTGCTFCRETLSDLSQQRPEIEQAGAGIVLVHLGEEPRAAEFLQKYGLEDLPRISDPTCRLYCQFGLGLGDFRQLFGLRVWLRGVKAGLLDGHWFGGPEGNPFQMPGVFVVECGRLLRGFQHEQASDRPNYVQLVQESLPRQVSPAV